MTGSSSHQKEIKEKTSGEWHGSTTNRSWQARDQGLAPNHRFGTPEQDSALPALAESLGCRDLR